MRKTRTTVELSHDEWEMIQRAWNDLDGHVSSMPYTYEDTLSKSEEADYHKVDCLLNGREYKASDYSDDEDDEDDDDPAFCDDCGKYWADCACEDDDD